MGDKPIIFSAPMVRALLDWRKTQTRRVIKPQPHDRAEGCYHRPDGSWVWVDAHRENNGAGYYGNRLDDRHFFTRYAVGDRLYVREQCAIWGRGPEREPVEFPVVYAADDAEWADIKHDARNSKTGDEWKIRPSIHMPRWASRLTLTVTDVRVQRLQQISEADAWAEGCKQGDPWDSGNGFFPVEEPSPDGKGFNGWDCARDWYADLWDRLHGPDAWDANPWVVAVSFSVRHGNIDQIGGTHD